MGSPPISESPQRAVNSQPSDSSSGMTLSETAPVSPFQTKRGTGRRWGAGEVLTQNWNMFFFHGLIAIIITVRWISTSCTYDIYLYICMYVWPGHGRRLRALAFWCLAEFTTDLARPQPRAPVRLLQKYIYIHIFMCYILLYTG